MSRHIIATAFSLAMLSSEGVHASQISKDSADIRYALQQIRDETIRERVWACVVQLSQNASWEVDDIAQITRAVASLNPEHMEAVVKSVSGLVTVKSLSITDICNIMRAVNYQSTEQMDVFAAMTEGKEWNADAFQAFATSLRGVSSEHVKELGRIFIHNTKDMNWDGLVLGCLMQSCVAAPEEKIITALKAIKEISTGKNWTGNEVGSVFGAILKLDCDAEKLDALVSLVICATKNRVCTESEVRSFLHHRSSDEAETVRAIQEFMKSIPQLEELDFSSWSRVVQHAGSCHLNREYYGDLPSLITLLVSLAEGLEWTGQDYAAALDSVSRQSKERQLAIVPVLKEVASSREWDARTYGECLLHLCNANSNNNKNAISTALDLISEHKFPMEEVGYITDWCATADKTKVLETLKLLEGFIKQHQLDKSQQSDFRHYLHSVPFNETSVLLNFIEPMVQRTGWHYAYAELMYNLSHLPKAQLHALSSIVIPAMAAKGLDGAASCQYIKALKNVPPKKMEMTLESSFACQDEQGISEADMGLVTHGLSQASLEQVKATLTKIKLFAQRRALSAVDQNSLVQSLAEQDWNSIEEVLAAIVSIAEGKDWGVFELSQVIRALSFVSTQGTLQSTVDTVIRFAEGKDWDADVYNDILIALGQTNVDRMDAAIKTATAVVEENQLPKEDIATLIHICSKQNGAKAPIISQLCFIMKDHDWPASLRSAFLSSMNNMAGQMDHYSSFEVNWQEMERTLKALITFAAEREIDLNGLSLDDLSKLMLMAYRVPEEKLNNIFRAGQVLASKLAESNEADCYNLAALLGDSSPEVADCIIEAAAALSKENDWSIEAFGYLIHLLRDKNPEAIKAQLETLKRVKGDRPLKGMDLVGVLHALQQDIPEDRMPVLMDAAERLLDRETYSESSGNVYFAYLSQLSDVPTEKLDKVVNFASEVCKYTQLDGISMHMVIERFESTSQERMDFVLKALPVISESVKLGYKAILCLVDLKTERLNEIMDTMNSLRSVEGLDEEALTALFVSLCQSPSTCQTGAVAKRIAVCTAGKNYTPSSIGMLATLYANSDIDSWDRLQDLMEPLCVDTASRATALIDRSAVLLPESMRFTYLEAEVRAFVADPVSYAKAHGWDDELDPLIPHILTMCVADQNYMQKLSNYWRDVMASDEPYMQRQVCQFIEENALNLGLEEDEDGGIVQMAIRVMTVLEDGDENGAHTIFEKMKSKRTVPVDWTKLKRVQGTIAGLNMRLNPERIGSFGLSLKVDYTSMPQVKSVEWIDLCTRLREALVAEDKTLMTNAIQIYKTTMRGYNPENGTFADQGSINLEEGVLELIDEACKPTEHFCRLMDASSKNMEGAKMKCVANYFLSLEDGEPKFLRICQFLAGVRGCLYGKDTAVQDYYMGLASEFRLKTMVANQDFKYDMRHMPAVTALFNTVQSVVSLQFSPESKFMREVCGVHVSDSEFEYAAHQIIWVKGLIGDKVGLTEGPRFDIHAGTANRLVLARTLQEVMEMYYERLELHQIIPLMRIAFDRLLVKDRERREAAALIDGEKVKIDGSIYSAMKHIYEQYKAKNPDEVFECAEEDTHLCPWVEFKYANDDDTTGALSITDRGMVRLMSNFGLLNEITDPLGWGH
jgi:hypothetical protein